MKHYLDTNICIYFLKGLYPEILQQITSHHPDDIKIASIVKAELLYGAEKSLKQEENRKNIIKFLLPFEIIPFDNKASEKYSIVRAKLEREGILIGPNDLILSSIVLAYEGVLVTNNEREFKRVDGLLVENWLQN